MGEMVNHDLIVQSQICMMTISYAYSMEITIGGSTTFEITQPNNEYHS